MNTLIYWTIEIVTMLLLGYAIGIAIAYGGIALVSIREIFRYQNIRKRTDYKAVLSSPFSPGISIIMPSYNEEENIVESVRSLLSLSYSNLEVIVVNDGSQDKTLEKLIEHYQLEKRAFAINPQLKTEPVRGIYFSKNRSFTRLLVIDKENGGKSDALNAAMNVSREKLIACVDADCIFEQDALLKMVHPFMEPGKNPVIATGGVIRTANSCVVKDGKLEEVILPKNFLARAQTLEYIRAFLLARMGWSRLDGLLVISGAFGLFDKDIVIKCGGYSRETVGEDMEVVVRMRRYMHDNDLPYAVKYIPDPLCWTEVPETAKMLYQQRNRWTRGTIETLVKHRRLFFNPKFGLLGMIGYPFWLIFEWFGPILEFLGILLFIFLACTNSVYWPIYFVLLAFVWTVHMMVSTAAIFMEERTFSQYGKFKDIAKMMFTAMVEPFTYHLLTLYSRVRGNISFLRKRKGWGNQTRVGYVKAKEV